MGKMKEEWRAVKGYEGLYEVSNLGRVKSLPKAQFKTEKILKPYINPRNGYCYVGLHKNNKGIGTRIHCIVMNAFNPVEKKPGYDPEYTIDHLDGDRTNNRLDNLEWCSQAENTQRALKVRKRNYKTRKVINLDTGEIFSSELDAAKSVGGKVSASIHKACTGYRSGYRNNRFAFYDDYINHTVPEFKGKFKKRSSKSLWH
jgi:hypothetical protein